ncbi:MAG: ribulose-phosphate 3-epimerase [Clostridia bacterium]
MIYISPSLLSFDFANIGKEAQELTANGADMLHCDVMDGVFVPNITFGIKFINDINKVCENVLDVHLMIINPEKYVELFISSGADIVTIHLEACGCVKETLQLIRNNGAKAGLSIKPNTPVEAIKPYLDLVDLILIMSVEPGFGGQGFIDGSLEKIKQARNLIGDRNILLEVDGGISQKNSAEVIKAGANCLVAGSAIFKSNDRAKSIIDLRKI